MGIIVLIAILFLLIFVLGIVYIVNSDCYCEESKTNLITIILIPVLALIGNIVYRNFVEYSTLKYTEKLLNEKRIEIVKTINVVDQDTVVIYKIEKIHK